MKNALAFALLLTTFVVSASPTRNNDDSCDISILPAATLLLPYFEVSQSGSETTLFTITNASPKEQIAHVTLWTDYAYPVIDFNIYLTGYDVQAIHLHDVIWRGVIAPDIGTGTEISDVGDFSIDNETLDLSQCDDLPGLLPEVYALRMQQAFTLGRIPKSGSDSGCTNIGGRHKNAVGYATIDVVRSCTTRNAAMAGYLTEDILWDNVLVGDYLQAHSSPDLAQGGPLVHLRAVPEGGTASERRNHPGNYEVGFHRTFYSRFMAGANQTFDARQPLPALFAARWVGGSAADFQTSFKIWREGSTTMYEPCSAYALRNVAKLTETVVFDEDENPHGRVERVMLVRPSTFVLPATSLVSSRDPSVFARPTTGAVGGWIYLNLDNGSNDGVASQNWVIVSMRAEGRYSAELDAFGLGNGCTPPAAQSEVVYGAGPIGPAANVNP